MGYLDDKGLTHLWKKITGRSIPVKALAQEEYDALTDSERHNGSVYIITDKEVAEGVTMEQVQAAISTAIGEAIKGAY